jgi:hypothetical protein
MLSAQQAGRGGFFRGGQVIHRIDPFVFNDRIRTGAADGVPQSPLEGMYSQA